VTPNLDRLGESARVFSHHYVQVPTCGASRCALLRGRYPSGEKHIGNDAIKNTSAAWADESLPATFRRNGYRTLALGKISHYPGGLTGGDWAEGPEEIAGVWQRAWVPESPWKTPQAMMHGYANGVARRPGKSPPFEAFDGPDKAYPDAWVADEAITTLADLAKSSEPWFFSVGFFKPHLPFAAPERFHDLHAKDSADLPKDAMVKPTWPSGWHGSGELLRAYASTSETDPRANPAAARRLRQAYSASVSYVDSQVGRVLEALSRHSLDSNTIVVVWSDHGFLLGEHDIWGKHCLFEQALLSPLIIRTPDLARPGATSKAIVETVDLHATMADLCRIEAPAGLDGRSLRPMLENPETPTMKPALGFWSGGQRTVRDDRWRLIVGMGGKRVELFDYLNDPHETRNHAKDHPEIVESLRRLLP
jgi:iduronate 2-sulfatase